MHILSHCFHSILLSHFILLHFITSFIGTLGVNPLLSLATYSAGVGRDSKDRQVTTDNNIFMNTVSIWVRVKCWARDARKVGKSEVWRIWCGADVLGDKVRDAL